MSTPPAERGAPASAPVVCLLSHTHWDREWYQPAGRFRQRLVALVDELLDHPGDAPFLLDGQTIVLEDYLEVCPERGEALGRALAAGSLEAGPWYVLADELIPSGEALVRNLLEGRRQLAALGGSAPGVLYCPDSFGHPAALPELAAGFGCEVVLLWRGYGGARWPAGDAARWRSASGTDVLLFHLPPDGYEFGSSLPADETAARARWAAMRNVLEPRAQLGVLFVQNGADHHARQRDLAVASQALARAAAPLALKAVSLGMLGTELSTRAAAVVLPVVQGELRDSYGYTWALQGTFASRAAQKRRNAAVQRLLEREVEPLVALACRDADRAERTRATSLVDAAWRTLLRCHPHDTLCGCSTDEVARAMDATLDDAASQASGLRDDALAKLVGWDAVIARDRPHDWRMKLVVYNPAAYERSGLAEVEIVTPVAAVGVGPGSGVPGGANAASTASATAAAIGPASEDPRFALVRRVGGMTVQVLSRRVAHVRLESPLHYPSDTLAVVERAVLMLSPLGGYATRSISLGDAAAVRETNPALASPVVRRGRRIANGRIALHVDRSGRMSLGTDRIDADRVDLEDLIRIESATDLGDLYTPSVRGVPVAAAYVGARLRHRGPLRMSVDLRYRLERPRAVGSARVTAIPITITLTVDAGSDVLGVRVRGRNRARDHRLRVGFATGLAGARVVADAAFGPVRREKAEVPLAEQVAETPPRTAPLHRYVSLYGPQRGVTLISDGLAEYEAADDGSVWVTLVRAVGELSRSDLPERPGHAGWPTPTPEAQCRGAIGGRFALMMHGADAPAVRWLVERRATEVLSPLRGVSLRAAGFGGARSTVPHIELHGAGLVCSALRLGGPDGSWIVARCINVTEDAVEGTWSFDRVPREAMLGRLDETPISSLVVSGAEVTFSAGPRAVVTVLVR